jgi:hypothetical protein
MASVTIKSNTPVFTRVVETVSFPNVEIVDTNRGVSINSLLPFRIRFTATKIPNSLGNIPAIPLQIIGFSNYIL